MSMHYKVRLIAGVFILATLALGWLVNPLWFLFTAFVGLNLVQSSLTHWCLMEDILRATGIHKDPAKTEGSPTG